MDTGNRASNDRYTGSDLPPARDAASVNDIHRDQRASTGRSGTEVPREVRPAETLGMPCAFCGRGISYVAGLGGCRRIVGRIACSDCADDYFMAVGSWGGTDEDREEAGRRWAERRGVTLDPGRNQ